MNPLKSNIPVTPDRIDSILQFLEKGPNAQQMVQQSLQNNPQAKQTIEQLKNVSNGMHPRDILFQLAKQRGIDPSRVMQVAQKFGLR